MCSCAVAGITADANILINYARTAAQRYFYAYQEPIPIEQLLQILCDLKQSYTQFGGLRPFGVSFLYAGWDEHFGFQVRRMSHVTCQSYLTVRGRGIDMLCCYVVGWLQLYQSDPSGNYGGWKATAIGANNLAAQSILKTDYKIGETSLEV